MFSAGEVKQCSPKIVEFCARKPSDASDDARTLAGYSEMLCRLTGDKTLGEKLPNVPADVLPVFDRYVFVDRNAPIPQTAPNGFLQILTDPCTDVLHTRASRWQLIADPARQASEGQRYEAVPANPEAAGAWQAFQDAIDSYVGKDGKRVYRMNLANVVAPQFPASRALQLQVFFYDEKNAVPRNVKEVLVGIKNPLLRLQSQFSSMSAADQQQLQEAGISLVFRDFRHRKQSDLPQVLQAVGEYGAWALQAGIPLRLALGVNEDNGTLSTVTVGSVNYQNYEKLLQKATATAAPKEAPAKRVLIPRYNSKESRLYTKEEKVELCLAAIQKAKEGTKIKLVVESWLDANATADYSFILDTVKSKAGARSEHIEFIYGGEPVELNIYSRSILIAARTDVPQTVRYLSSHLEKLKSTSGVITITFAYAPDRADFITEVMKKVAEQFPELNKRINWFQRNEDKEIYMRKIDAEKYFVFDRNVKAAGQKMHVFFYRNFQGDNSTQVLADKNQEVYQEGSDPVLANSVSLAALMCAAGNDASICAQNYQLGQYFAGQNEQVLAAELPEGTLPKSLSADRMFPYSMLMTPPAPEGRAFVGPLTLSGAQLDLSQLTDSFKVKTENESGRFVQVAVPAGVKKDDLSKALAAAATAINALPVLQADAGEGAREVLLELLPQKK